MITNAKQQHDTCQCGCAEAARPDKAGAHAGREGPAAGGAGAAGWAASAAGGQCWQRQGRPARATAVAGRRGPRNADAAGDLLLVAEMVLSCSLAACCQMRLRVPRNLDLIHDTS